MLTPHRSTTSSLTPAPHGLTCICPPTRFTPANAVARNPLVVQFWLLGIDAARGDLRARGFHRDASPVGSSTYTLGDLTLHSAGLWIRQPGATLHYLRPSETFYQLPAAHPHTPDARLRPVNGAGSLRRAHGLNLVHPHVLEHEAWIAARHGRAYRAGLLSGRLPPKVRHLVPAWEAWIARQVDLRTWSV